MSALDSRWPITSPAWSVGVSPDAQAAYWRVRLYAVAAAETCTEQGVEVRS